jgi:hypothetical protein
MAEPYEKSHVFIVLPPRQHVADQSERCFFCLTTLASSCQSSGNGNGNLSRNCRWQSVEMPDHVGGLVGRYRETHGDHTLFHQSEGWLRQEFDLLSSVGLLGRAWLRGAAGRCRPPGFAQSGFLWFRGNRAMDGRRDLGGPVRRWLPSGVSRRDRAAHFVRADLAHPGQSHAHLPTTRHRPSWRG